MSITMYSASVPVMARMLRNMLQWMEMAAAHAEAKKFDPAVYLAARLAPDMLPFSRQIQMASDAAKGCAARLAALDNPSFEDTEATFDELRGRIDKTLAFIESVPASAIEGSELREILLPLRGREPLKFTGEAYLKHFALPNFFFHCTTAYALLRHNGVGLGKMDFLGRPG